MGEVKDTILSQSWGQTGQGAGKGGMLGAFPPGHLGGHGAVQEDKGPRKDPHPGRTVRRSRYQLAQAGSHSSPQIPGGKREGHTHTYTRAHTHTHTADSCYRTADPYRPIMALKHTLGSEETHTWPDFTLSKHQASVSPWAFP